MTKIDLLCSLFPCKNMLHSTSVLYFKASDRSRFLLLMQITLLGSNVALALLR